jgi:glycosyltransferase involved in cell wall biosynthesis
MTTQLHRRPSLGIVSPFYNEGEQASRFITRVSAVLAEMDVDWSLVCINDGSRDGTLARLLAEHQRDPRIKVIDLSRNFGKEYALSAGLDHCDADAVVLMDSDLQHPPEMLPEMLAKWREGYDVVYMIRGSGGLPGPLGRAARNLFYLLFRLTSEIELPTEAGDFRLMDSAVVQAIRRLPERTRFMKGIYHWVGFRQVGLVYEKAPRNVGKSKWGMWRLTAHALDGITAFSDLPLRLSSFLGALIAGLSLVYGVARILRSAVYGIDVPGYESIIVAILFLGGIQLLSLGILGGYVGRIFKEVKARPLYVVRRTYGLESPPGP